MSNPFRYFNSSPEIIRLAVLMYVKYPLSLRNVEDLLAERGIDISHETVRFWWNRFGPMFAAEIRKRRVAHMRGYPQWRWHLDEAFVKVNGKLCYLWRAVDHEGEVLEAVVTAKRDKAAALKFLKRIMKKYGRPLSVVTDGLCSYPAAMKEIGNADRQEAGRRLNNRAENSHQPFRRRERAMQRFRSMKTLQKFSSVHAQVHNHFNQTHHPKQQTPPQPPPLPPHTLTQPLHPTPALSEQFFGTSLAVVASGHERPVPIFQQLARSDPSGRDDVREVPAIAAQCRGSLGRARDRHQP